jgi:hypothetical protein
MPDGIDFSRGKRMVSNLRKWIEFSPRMGRPFVPLSRMAMRVSLRGAFCPVPGAAKEAHWLPARTGEQLYWPQETSIIDGTWAVPSDVRVGG